MRIVLAIDGSEQSDAAVDEIAHRHVPPDSEVRVISVVEFPYFAEGAALGGANMAFYAEIEATAFQRANEIVAKAATKLRSYQGSRQLNVTTDVKVGSPKQVILEDAEAFSADLIVVGSHGCGMLERFLLGSVSQSVALHARCSVEIVRRPGAPKIRMEGSS